MTPEIGEFVKVHLPGEAPWAEAIAIDGDRLTAKISNNLVCTSLHNLKFGDVVVFVKTDGKYGWYWELKS